MSLFSINVQAWSIVKSSCIAFWKLMWEKLQWYDPSWLRKPQGSTLLCIPFAIHDDVIKWKHFPCYWPFVRGIHRSPVNSPHKGQWRGALVFSLICVWINGWVNNGEAADLRRYCANYDVIVMCQAVHNQHAVSTPGPWFNIKVSYQ